MFPYPKLRVVAVVVLAIVASISEVAFGRASATRPPATVSGIALPSSDTGSFAHRGRLVRASRLGIRSYVGSKNGFALASVGDAQYPANTTDGGRTWRIDGPHFHVNAANAPDVVTRTGVTGRSTYFAYAGPTGGQTVIVSLDAGKHWWRTYFNGVPLTVEPSFTGGRPALLTIVEAGANKFLAYVSTDGGRHWRYETGLI